MAQQPLATNWTRATEPDDQLLALILLLVSEWIQLSGRMPTVAELKRAIRHPGS